MSYYLALLRVRNRALLAGILISLLAHTLAEADPLVPANASFSASSNVDLLTHNFGVVRQGAPAAVFDFAINNLPAVSGTTANLSLVGTDSIGESSAIALVYSPIEGLPADEHADMLLQLSTNVTGELAVSYKLIFASDGLPEAGQEFLAVAAFATVLQAGDYNADGDVDLEDYLAWKSAYGSLTSLAADGNFNGVVDTADYTVWRDNFVGSTELGSASDAMLDVAAVPEPGSSTLAMGAIAIGMVSGSCASRGSRRQAG